MTALDTFFADIGAGGLSTAVVAPAPGTQGPATQLYGRLQEEINGVNDKTLSLLKDNWDDFKGQLKEGDELIKRLEEEERELKDLEDVVDGPDAFLPPLVEQLTSHQSLSAAHLLTTTSITLLSALLTFHTTTHALATATTSGDLPAAVDALRSVTSAVEEGAEDWIEETDVWKSLVRWAGEEESRLESAVLSALESCFEITPASSTNSHTSTLTLRERVAAAPGGPQLAVSTLFEAMEEFATVTGRKAQGEGVLQRLAKGVVRHFVAPFLEANGGLGGKAGGEAKKLVKPRLAFGLEEEKEEGVHVVSLSPVGEDAPAPKAKDALTDLSSFLAFFSAHSSLFPSNADDTPSKYATILTAHLTPPLQSHLISSHLSPSLPSSTATLPTYLSLLDSASKFESTFLPEHHYFAFLPFRTRSGGREVEEQRVIRSWAQRVPNHWAKAVGDEALAKIRTAVKGWDWGEGETVEVEVKEEEEMMGLLLGLGMAGDEDGKETGGSGKGLEGGKKPGQLALETVPKGAKREMTIEEATAPKPPRPKTPPRQPTPPPAAPPAVVAEPEPTPVLAPAPTGGKRGKLGAARIAPSVLPPRSPSPPPLFQGGDAPPPPSTDYAPSAAPASLPVPSEKTSTISLLSSSLSSPTSPDANLAATSTFSLLEKPLTSPSEIETTADLAPDEEVSRPHQYGSNAMRDGLEAAKKEEVEEEVKKEEDEEEKSEGKEEEEDRKPFIKQESVEPEPQGAPSESMLFGGRGDVGASPSFSPRVDVPPEQEREVKEESLEPEVPPSQPATSFAAPLATAAHSPPAATTYSPPATTEVQQPEYGGYEPTPYQPPSPAQPVETFEQEEAEQGEEAAPYEPSRYEPTPYQPPTPYEPTPYQPPAPYEPTPYQPPEPEPEAEEQQQPKEEEQDDEVAPYEATSYEPTPYQPPAEQDQQGEEDIAPYEVEPYQPTPYEPTPYEPPADAVPDEAEQQYGGEPKEENDVAPYDPTPYQPSAYEPTPYREPTPPAQEEPVAQPEVEEQQHAYEPGAYQPHSYEPSSGYEPAAYESSGYQPEQQEQEKQAFEPGHQAFPSTASDDEYERAMREWQPSPAAQPENQQDSMPAPSSTYESNAYQSSSYEPSAYEPQQEYQPEHRYEPEQQVQPQQPEDSHYQYGQSAQSWQPTSSPYDPPQQAASPAAPPVPVIVSPPPVLPPQPASAAAAPPPPRASAGFSSARPAVQQQRRVVSPSVTSPTSQPQNAYAPPSPARATPPRSTYPLSGPIFRPPSRPSSAQSQNNGPVLNHIQQRFASPPPGNHNPYVPLGVLAGGPPLQQQTPGGSYLPLNDPLFAGLLGSGSGSKPASSGNYFTPDPPGARLHRSGSVSSQTSNSSFSRGGAAGGGYRPSSSASNSRSPVGGYAPPQQHYQPPQQQQHYQPQQQHAYNAHSYNPNAYASQGGGYGVQEEVEELQDSYANGYGGQQQQYNPYAYGAEQPAMRLRGGAYLSDWEDEDEEGEDEWDEEDVEEDRPVLRLRGGADLGEMDDDDGNRSADDWGFGDDAGTGDVEEDAWGFGDEDEDASAPSPPPPPAPVKAPAPPPARATATTAPPVPTGPSHAPSASITSTTSSTGTLSRSRPPSYAFSPSLAPPPLPSSVFGGEVDEADEEGAGGDEWGFGDEDLEAPSPAVEEPVEAVVPPPRAATPPQPSPPAPASVSAPLAPAFSSPTPPPSQLVQTVPAFQPEAEPETVSPVEDVVDDWGFGAEDDAAPLEPVEDAQVVAEEPSDMLEYKKAIEEHDEVHEDPPMPTVADEVVGTEEAPVQEEQQVDEQLFSAPEPISAVRQPSPPPQEPISSVEAEPEPAAEDEGWGLDEEAADEAEPEQNEASVEEHAAPLVGAMEAQAPVISSPPLDTPSEVPSPVVPTRDLALDAFPLGTTETLPAEPDEPAPVEPAFAGVEFEVQPVEEAPEEPSPAAEPVEEPTAPSALTAPAAELTDPFPIEPKVEAPRLPTPQIPAPLPHHDVAEASMVEPQSTEEALQGVASAELDDANLFEAGQPEDDGWGLDGEEDEAVPTDLAPVESFLPDGKEAATQEHDVPIETSLLNPEPAMEDFADFTPVEHEDDNVPLRSPFQTQAAWEPFEEPSGVPVGAAAQPSPVHEDDEPLAPEEREAALNRAERLIEEEATVPNMARKELHELAATYPPTASSSREPSDPSIATREGTMSSPEVIEHSDAWGFDGDSAPAPAEGAEVLEASAAEPAVHDGEQDSVVQHEYARPALHDESAVEHVAHRPLVQPEDKDAAIVLPAHDAHPQERTFSPPPESVPAPAEEDDASGWDLGEEDASTPPQEAVEPERARQVEQAEKPASTAEEDWDFGSQQLDAQAAEVLEATETPAEEPAPPPASESAVQHISQRDVEPAEHSPTSPPPPVELAQPQQHTFSPSPSSLPAEKPYSAEAQQEPRAEEGWDFDASQADVPAAAEMLESTQASVEDAAPPPSDESAVQHISQRDVEHVEHDATSSHLPVELAQPQQHTFSPPPSALPVEEPVPAEPQEEEPAAAADEGWDSDAQQDDVPAAAEALESPQTAVEEAAPPPPAESAVQHISQRPVEPVEPAPDSPPLPAQLAQPQEHTFSPPPSAVPADDDAFADDPWDLDPVEPTPVSEQPSAAKTSALSSFAEETPMVGAEPEVEQQQEEDSWNFGEQHEAAEVLEADPEEQVVEKVPPPPPADESAVQHEQDRPVVETAPEETAAGAVQPQEHTFDIPPSAAPAEEPLARALSPQPPSPASEEAPTENGGDDGWGWDGEAAEEQASQEPVSAVKAIPNLPRHVDEPVPRAASPPPPSFAAPRAPSPPPVAPRSSPPPPALAAPASSVPPSVTAPAPEPAASSAPRSVAQPAPSASAPPTESAEADEWGWNDDAEDDSSKPSQPAPPAQQLIVEEVPKEVQPEEPEEPSPPPIRREKMMVSKRSKEIVKIAEEVLLEALKVASPSFEHPEFASATAPLLQTFVSLLSLYRATAAVHNSNLLASVPAIGMQFANDADWIGREVERIWREATEGKQLQVSEDQAMDVELAIQSTRQLGKDTRSKQVSIQRAALMESLDEAGGFLRTSDDSRYSACERALQQVTHTLQRLALVWKPVMTPTALYTTLGGLINEVLLRILDEIEDQDDISEEESIRLNALCKMLHELESLFEGSETSVGREVPVWFKFVFLSELLEASMADIMFLFSEQHLLDFTPQEIAKLMRALFADSALRNRNIEKVLQGHPPAAPDEGGDGW